MRTSCSPKPRGSARARRSRAVMSSSARALRTKTLQRDRRALLTSKDGFSVVAPIRMIDPFSTKGRNASCCALLKRWISSTKTMVRLPVLACASACFMTSRISLMPLVTAEKSMNEAQVRRAITRAKVVLPTPGGPQKIIEGVRSASIMERRALPGPIWWDWPTTSSREAGRIRSARGRASSATSSNRECCWPAIDRASCVGAGRAPASAPRVRPSAPTCVPVRSAGRCRPRRRASGPRWRWLCDGLGLDGSGPRLRGAVVRWPPRLWLPPVAVRHRRQELSGPTAPGAS